MIVDRFTGRRADELKRDENTLAAILREAGAEVKGRDVRCPFCDDKKPSGSIYPNDKSKREFFDKLIESNGSRSSTRVTLYGKGWQLLKLPALSMFYAFFLFPELT